MLLGLISLNTENRKAVAGRLPAIVIHLLSAAVVAVAYLGGCQSEQSESRRTEWTTIQVESLLQTLVPERYWTSELARQFFEQQAEAIFRDSLDPMLVATVIGWHRTEVSDVSGIDGYVTYPLVERMDFELGLDSVVPLTVTELNKVPPVGQDIFFFPTQSEGLPFHGNLLEQFSKMIAVAGKQFDSPEHFYDICIKFMGLANRNPQVALANQRHWQLYMAVDSLVRDSLAEPEAAGPAREIHDFVMSQRCVSDLDSLPQSIRLLDYLDTRHRGWGRVATDFGVVNSTPSLRKGVYRAQIDFLDSVTLQVLRVVFTYSKEKEFGTTVAQLHPAERRRSDM